MNTKILKYKVGDEIDISLSLEKINNFTFNEYDKSSYLNDQVVSSINPIINSEQVAYYPIQVDEMVFYIKENNIQQYYSDFGFTQNDVDVYSNRFKKTELRINFFDSANPSNQTLIHQVSLNTQGNVYQRETNGDLFSVNNLPLIFNIETPFKNLKKRKNSLGYGIPFFKYPANYTLPLKVYASFSLLNALNGKTHRLYASDVALNISNLYEYLYIEYTLNMLNDNYFYTINSTNRLINTILLKKEITLNILNVS